MKLRVTHLSFILSTTSCVDAAVEPARPTPISKPRAATTADQAPDARPKPEPPRRGDVFSVVLRDVPERFTADDALAEWGSLTPKEPTATNPADARSRVALAVDGSSVKLAAELGGVLKDGFTLTLSVPPPALAPVGEFFTRSGSPARHDCEWVLASGVEGSVDRTRKKTPKETKRCQAELDAHAALVTAQALAFTSELRVHASGAVERKEGAEWRDVTSARRPARSVGDGVELELELPLSVLPRLTQAPWVDLQVELASLDGAAGPTEALKFPTPIGFEPLADIRARTIEALSVPRTQYTNATAFPPGLSYHPTKPTALRAFSHAGPNALRVEEDELFRKQAELGDVEIGLVHAYGDFVAVRKKGVLTEFVSLAGDVPVEYAAPVRIKGIVEREKELHVIAFREGGFTQQYGWRFPGWIVIAVDQAGQVRDRTTTADGVTCSSIVEEAGIGYPVHSAKESNDKELLTLRMKGTAATLPGDILPFEVVHRWDADNLRYRTTPLARE